MRLSCLAPSVTVLMLLMLEVGESFTIEKCHPTIMPRLPPRMKAICYSLLKTLAEYDAELNNLGRSNAMEYFLPEDKREGPDHVFLRFG